MNRINVRILLPRTEEAEVRGMVYWVGSLVAFTITLVLMLNAEKQKACDRLRRRLLSTNVI